jgi:SAM-dependent methyltransferase
MTTSETSEHVRKNREHWEGESDEYQERNRAQLNRWDFLGWGVYDAPEDEVGALGDVAGLRALELGCGACQFGLDFSITQLRHGLKNFEETAVRFPLVQASGERVPFRDESFDLVFCDHGVMGFADPFLTVPEVARVLRHGGRFVFNGTTPWIWVAWGQQEEELPATREMRSDYFGLRSAEFEDPSWRTTEFQLTYGDWIRLFRANGLSVEDLIELRPSEDATTTYDDYAPLDWARAFPAEHIWKVRKE